MTVLRRSIRQCDGLSQWNGVHPIYIAIAMAQPMALDSPYRETLQKMVDIGLMKLSSMIPWRYFYGLVIS